MALTVAQLRRVIDLREKIDQLQAELSKLTGGEIPIPATTKPAATRRGRRGHMSAAGRARVAEGQRARWARVRAEKMKGGKAADAGAAEKKESAKAGKKRKLSPAARAAIAAAQKARWERVRAAKQA